MGPIKTIKTFFVLVVYIPESHLQSVKQALFAADAGKIGNYHQCCWQIAGTGQFRPVSGHKAFIGEIDKLSTVKEFRVEMVCKKQDLKAITQALKKSHPYETPAFHFYQTV